MIPKINRYLQNGYIDFDSVTNIDCISFYMLWGGRATGKTYGACKYVAEKARISNDNKFLWIRRTEKESKLISTETGNIFKSINDDNEWEVHPLKQKSLFTAYYDCEKTENGYNPIKLLGYIGALSTVGNFRGYDLSDVSTIIFDEFIKTPSARPIKNEGDAILDLYESINRNREFAGKEPLKLICLSNANDLGNPIFLTLNIVDRAEYMVNNGKYQYIDYGRGIALFSFDDSVISKKKSNTALYKLIGENHEYSKMALNNEFAVAGGDNIISQQLGEYKPLCVVSSLCIYKHKSKLQYYVTFHKSGTYDLYGSSDIEIKRFLHKYIYLWEIYMNNLILFETYTSQRTFENIFQRTN